MRAARTREWWKGEIGRWEQSGRSAAEFAAGKGYSPRTLTWWRSAVRRVGTTGTTPKVELVPVVVSKVGPAPLWVEIGGARVEVRGGFDAALLRDVVVALRGTR